MLYALIKMVGEKARHAEHLRLLAAVREAAQACNLGNKELAEPERFYRWLMACE